ncbi:hypothetical protein [Bacteroides gallinaceum]|uniref:AraC family transcriptional regulator n=1 Tax=Bacteroides gallinaceum TaxID=1462571 RepID=A0ABT7VF11_9BACE|nr:hypothetical protein [Bacteroides gallinaceum]MDM8324891.1 hypothetical protein [Bacteroides gallinaceum]
MPEKKKTFIYSTSDWKDVKGKSIRTDGCILIFCEEGMATASAEFKPRTVRKRDVILIFPDTMFVVNDVSELFSVKQIEISSEMFDEATFTLSS